MPVDFSACSEKALQYAIAFAKQFGAEIVLLHVVQPYVPVPEMGAIDTELLLRQMRDGAERELTAMRQRITEDIKIRTQLRVGRADSEIVRAADELEADLILLSTHGRTGLGRVFMGSVAEHITRYARCPVLTVREREHEFINVPEQSPDTARASNEFQPV